MTRSCMVPRIVIFLSALVALPLVWAGCAAERAPINRVQPYYLDKAFFVGKDLKDPGDNPEFWTQATLIDVGYGAAQFGLFNSTFTQNLSRVRFDVTEDYLFARLAYERIEDSDGKGAGPATNDGQIVAAFRIESHFDIVRDYNPTTGEQLNVLNENTTDRPWYERQYMRVNWSKNENTDAYDFDTLSLLGVFGGVDYEPLAYDVTDPNDPNAPVFEQDAGYFDVTNKAFAKPAMVDLSHLGWGIDKFPACMLPADLSGGSAPEGNCNPVELTIRQSFRKVEDHDFEPRNWDGYRFQAAGGFVSERHGYARNYGMSDDKWHRFLNHYQIWKRSHYYEDPDKMEGHVPCYTPETTPAGADPHRDSNKDGTEDECAAVGPGSRCDTFKQRCTLPFALRETATVPWYYTEADSDEFFEPTAAAAHEWDVASRVAARAAQYAECQETKGQDCAGRFPVYFGQQDENRDAIDLARDVDDCRHGHAYEGEDCDALADALGQHRGYSAGVIAIAKMPEVIVLCHSPVQADDPEACGTPRLPAGITAADCAAAKESGGDADTLKACEQALTARLGDLRYHKISIFKQPQTPSPWGIYADAEDPLTGETISASVNVWGWVNDYIAQQYVDIMRYIKGELSAEEVTEGEYIRKWVEAQEKAGSGGVLPRLSREDFDKHIASFTGVEAKRLAELRKALPSAALRQAHQVKQKLTGIMASADVLPASRAVYAARQQAARGTEFEAQLITPMIQQLNGVRGMPLSANLMHQISPLGGGNPALRRDLNHALQNKLAERGGCLLHAERVAAPVSLPALADKLQAKFGAFNPKDSQQVKEQRAERMRRYLARRFNFSVVAHEMGHSVGLRHNFVSSSDAWQFRPQYWQLRTRNGKVQEECKDLVADGASCVGPRWFDPVTKEERDNLIWMWMHSTVMEYPGDIAQDMLGLSIWDFAAMRLLYGDVATVGQDATMSAASPTGKAMLSKMDNFGGILGMRPGVYNPLYNTVLYYHYSQMQKNLGLIKNCRGVTPDKYKPARWDAEVNGKWEPVIDGMLVNVDGSWTRCAQQQVDYVPYTALRMPTEQETPGYYRGGPSVDGSGRLRMPYGFGTDNWADLGNLSVYRHDNGADAYEIFNFLITQQEVGHIFDNYRRGRESFSVRSAADRTLTRYNAKIRDGAKGLTLMRNVYEMVAINSGYDIKTFWPSVASLLLDENILASSIAFDHFTRVLARPEIGEHYLPKGDTVLRSKNDDFGQGGDTLVVVPNGATGYYEAIGLGGKLVENKLAEDKGEYNSQYTVNAGSYYDKLSTAMLMTESVDNFISDSRLDFVDPRYRAVSLADLFADGYRRWLANNLTDDDELKGPRIAANAQGQPLTDQAGYPQVPLGWTSWWGDTPTLCFPADGTMMCSAPGGPDTELKPQTPQRTAVLDPQVGWEQQKFLIAWTMLYLPENEQSRWLDQMRIWELGRDADPGIDNRIEFHDPDGRTYVAKTFGKETIFGKTVQRGIAARVIEQANEYLREAYVTTAGPDLDGDGNPDWYLADLDPATGQPIVKYDPTVSQIGASGNPVPGIAGCNATDSSKCTCTANRACIKLKGYVSVPSYLREAIHAYRLGLPGQRGVY